MVIMPFLLSAKAKRKARAENCGEKNCRKKTYVHEEERMRRYETIYILRPNAGEDEINRVVESTSKIILDEKGTIIETDKWGMKKLAYLIKKESLGYYVYCDYAGTPAAVSEIERKFRIDDTVLKYMTIKTAASITEENIQEALAAITAKATALLESEEADTADSENADETKTTEETEK
jgi:small subunit ribosomal protein S6